MKPTFYMSPAAPVRFTGLLGLGVAIAMASLPAVAQVGPQQSNELQPDVLTLNAGLSITRDDNVTKTPEGANLSQFGTTNRGDTFLKGSLGINFDREISQQRVQANAQVDGYKYNTYDSFDNVGYNAGLNYDWVIGRPFFGRVGARLYSYEPAISDGQAVNNGTGRNKIERQLFNLNGGMRFTPSWAAIVGAEFDRRRNSLDIFQGNDANINTIEAGLRFAPGSGAEFDFVYRRSKGDLLNLQNRTINNEPLLRAISNDYTQDQFLVRLQYRPSEESRVAGRIGYSKRKYDEFPELRDYSGLVAGFDIDWAPSGITFVRVSFGRDIESEDVVTTSAYAVADSFAVRPTIRVTGKIELSPYFQYIDRKYTGEIAGTAQGRKDTFQSVGLGVRYEIRRNLSALADFHQEKRDSNYAPAVFTANVMMLGVQARF